MLALVSKYYGLFEPFPSDNGGSHGPKTRYCPLLLYDRILRLQISVAFLESGKVTI